ncbi:MAG: hypothetical protein JRI23_02090 [Deltaproteobacteria bacterium]|jgi:hypothetical protein|nr:hypothetical protein [Deltaproteobacteria bacterium]MBW2530269.1 hypothetical protein [Deltaproteobacteria bacterium]
MRTYFAAALLLFLAPLACAATPSADGPSSDRSDRCPPPTAACMNEDNHAQCRQVAASCAGEVLQLESCPLQFSCSEP